MAKALMGSFAPPRSVQLLDEVRLLRQRVAELEAALAEAQSAARERETVVALDAEAVSA